MNCFVDLAILRSFCGNTPLPQGSVFVDSLPGISKEMLSNIADSDVNTFLQLFNDIQNRASISFYSEVLNAISKCVTLKRIAGTNTYGFLKYPGTDSLYPANKYAGLAFRVYGSPSVEYTITSVSFYSFNQGNNQFRLYDMNFGDLIATFPFVATFGYNEVPINFKLTQVIGNRVLALVYDTNNIAFSETTLKYDPECCIPCNNCCNDCEDNCCSFVRGILFPYGAVPFMLGAQPVLNHPGIEFTDTTSYGISVNISTNCTLEPFICRHKHIFLDAWLSYLGKEIFLERLHSPEINRYTSLDRETIEKGIVYYDEQFRFKLKEAVRGMQLPCDECYCKTPKMYTQYGTV